MRHEFRGLLLKVRKFSFPDRNNPLKKIRMFRALIQIDGIEYEFSYARNLYSTLDRFRDRSCYFVFDVKPDVRGVAKLVIVSVSDFLPASPIGCLGL